MECVKICSIKKQEIKGQKWCGKIWMKWKSHLHNITNILLFLNVIFVYANDQRFLVLISKNRTFIHFFLSLTLILASSPACNACLSVKVSGQQRKQNKKVQFQIHMIFFLSLLSLWNNSILHLFRLIKIVFKLGKDIDCFYNPCQFKYEFICIHLSYIFLHFDIENTQKVAKYFK